MRGNDDLDRVHQTEKFRSHILGMLAGNAPLSRVLESIVSGVEQLSPNALSSILLLGEDGTSFSKTFAPHLPDFYNSALVGITIGPGVGSCGTAAFTGECVIVEDIATHPYWVDFRDLAARASLGACWSQPIRSSSGKVLGTFAIYHRTRHEPLAADLTLIDQSAALASIAIEKDAEAQKLRDSEERYRTLVEWSPDPVLVHRLGTILYVNSAAIKVFGATDAHGLVGKLTSELVHPDFRAQQTARMRSINASLAIEPMVESRFLRLDGVAIDVEVQGTSIVYDGAPAIHVSIRDITRRKQAERSTLLAASVFTHAQEGIMMTTADGVIIDVNSAFSRITGYSREEVLGHNPRMLSSGRQEKSFYDLLFDELARNGQWVGEIWNRRKSGEVYAQLQNISEVRDAQGRLQHYVSLFSDITQIKDYQQHLERMAHFDALTQLPNRLLLADRLQQAMAQAQRRAGSIAVVYLDLDGFKAVNDHHGHAVGDELLIAVSQRMKAALRDGDTLARVGGDEFVAVLVDLAQADDTAPVLDRLLQAAADPVKVGAALLYVSASMGVAMYPRDSADAQQLLRHADHAMYQAKKAGRNRFQLFNANPGAQPLP